MVALKRIKGVRLPEPDVYTDVHIGAIRNNYLLTPDFEAFQRAARPGGTGLGLAIAAELVRAHGGELKLSSTGAEGSAFILTIPDRVGELRSGRRGERKEAEG